MVNTMIQMLELWFRECFMVAIGYREGNGIGCLIHDPGGTASLNL